MSVTLKERRIYFVRDLLVKFCCHMWILRLFVLINFNSSTYNLFLIQVCACFFAQSFCLFVCFSRSMQKVTIRTLSLQLDTLKELKENCGKLEKNCGELKENCMELKKNCGDLRKNCLELKKNCGELKKNFGEPKKLVS